MKREYQVLKKEDMHVVGDQFGIRWVTGGAPEGLVELYTEDDENYFLVTTFNHVWLEDLLRIAGIAQRAFDKNRHGGRNLVLEEPNQGTWK